MATDTASVSRPMRLCKERPVISRRFYGDAAAMQLTTPFEQHISIAGELVAAALTFALWHPSWFPLA